LNKRASSMRASQNIKLRRAGEQSDHPYARTRNMARMTVVTASPTSEARIRMVLAIDVSLHVDG